MKTHRNAKLGLAGRYALVRAIEAGVSQKAAAAAFCVSPATAHRWFSRWQEASAEARASRSCLCDRSSRPRSSPRRLAAHLEARICAARRRTGWGPRLLGPATGFCHQTVWKVLRRAGLSRPARAARAPARAYEWPCPGELLHMDTKPYARFDAPGRHPLVGKRSRPHAQKKARPGLEVCHAIVDDHSRLAYAELLADAKAASVTAFTARALAWFGERGIVCRRLMTDNAWAYTQNRSLAELLAQRGIRHLVTRPYRPQTNGKVERFHQTIAREWAYGMVYASSQARAAALPYWLDHYNRSRPHSALAGKPPISRSQRQ